MSEPYVILNNYNYALNEDFDYLDGFEPKWRESSEHETEDSEKEPEEKDN